jgi:hypothetical protein
MIGSRIAISSRQFWKRTSAPASGSSTAMVVTAYRATEGHPVAIGCSMMSAANDRPSSVEVEQRIRSPRAPRPACGSSRSVIAAWMSLASIHNPLSEERT